MYRQLKLFDVKEGHSYQCSDYILLEDNKHTYNLLMNNDTWNCFLLYGKPGSGKTHLAHIWQELKRAVFITYDVISSSINAIYRSNAVIIEDIDSPIDESWVFHCYNYAKEIGRPLLMTSSTPPNHIDYKLKDLKSRIVSTMSASLADPTEELLRIALVKLFTNLQMHTDAKTINYILNNTERSFKKISDIVNLIYTELPGSASGVTIPFVRSILRRGGAQFV
ncbi:P-loop NTPase family protein [Anaplasma bovis]|uniref:chromosomal DNA replication initiator n=1 Tax=Anaplasma bovis TaxID=186733 RepID=UPI002FF334D1